ncbi:serine hydrolase domain-containing protein [Aeromicrobium chenweiae]|uniref:Serine hydrolase n=1 Tax=Aeromicrobium chenweiae TaxID=2079793 RepID=A0A2S0WKS4_9ACTN|nr:serine hydrolase domain-containing protein [Aeromicrobium chenweiae]AWB91943.1 serine hydrolase [Aeromicrobium chenweiae]TGN32795.1 class A beta-lactamase-related serine hydrolase [Aeromicrobium chenweiae]
MTLDATTSAALTRRLAVEQSTHRLPSVAAAVVRQGEIVWSDAAGNLDGRASGEPATPDTQYRIGSISKTFVAVEVMRLRDEGRLAIGDTIGTHLPEVPFGHVTIAQLLTHTSGLQAENDGDWWERSPGSSWADLLASGAALRATPGTGFHYSNLGYAVLGELVARLRDRPWQDAVRDGILTPLGMHRTTTRPEAPAAPGLAVHPLADLLHVEPEHDAVAMSPAGQLWSTAEDLSTWAAFLAGRTQGVLAESTLREMLRPVAVADVPGAAWVGAHGLGWQMWNVEGRRYAGHGGSMPGFLAGLRVDLESGDGVVLMTNATSGLGTVTPDLLEIVREREPVAPTPWHADPSQADDLDLVGPWYWGTYAFTLALGADGGLRLGEPGQGRGARFRRDGAGWTGLEGYYRGEPLTVERDADGRPERLVLASFVFTRTPYDPAVETPGGIDAAGWH